jgi:DNA invertase Pin-like site-specific DNA recombinase
MKGQAVPLGEQQQRKEARRKEAVMPKTNYQEERDREDPRVAGGTGDEPSLDTQRELCRSRATELGADIGGEFVDKVPNLRFRPGLYRATVLCEYMPIDYLIISSLDRLPDSRNQALVIGLRIGRNRVTLVTPNTEVDPPLMGAMLLSRD